MSDLSTSAPEGAAPESVDTSVSTDPAATGPAAGDPGPGAPATAESHGTEEAANQANADAALAGDETAFDALPSYWQKQVRQLRDEAAENRVARNRYEKPLSALDQQEQDWLLSLAQDLGTADTQVEAARRMRAVADSLLEGQPEPEEEARPLTYADYERIRADEARAAQEEEAIQSVFSEAKELGYDKDTPDFALLMWLAANPANQAEAGDLKAAHKRIEDGRRAIIDSWVAEQRAKGANFPAQAAATGAPPAQQGAAPKDWKDARARAEARAAAIRASLA